MTPQGTATTRRLYGHIESGRFVWVRKNLKTGQYIVLLHASYWGIGDALCKALDMAETTMREAQQ